MRMPLHQYLCSAFEQGLRNRVRFYIHDVCRLVAVRSHASRPSPTRDLLAPLQGQRQVETLYIRSPNEPAKALIAAVGGAVVIAMRKKHAARVGVQDGGFGKETGAYSLREGAS